MPSTFSTADKIQLVHDLRSTVRELRDRGLLVSAKWASELLSAVPVEFRTAPYLPFSPPVNQVGLASSPLAKTSALGGMGAPATRGRPSTVDFLPSPGFDESYANAEAGPSRARTRHGIELEEEEDPAEEDLFQLGKSYFDIRELGRVVHILAGARGARARFLRNYAAFLDSDRKAQENLPHFLDTKAERTALFPLLNPILAELARETEPYLVYLRGLIHLRLDQRDLAIESFVQSLKDRPYNWSCWSQLAQLIDSANQFIEIKDQLPMSPMMTFFAISVMLDLHTATDLIMSMIDELQKVFPESVHLKAQRAMVYYHMRDFPKAEKQFDLVQRLDPFRMEEVDIYSNMLYVMGKKDKLGYLAHEYAAIDRNRPEVCCLIGNYYSSRNDHTKAITYFKRALMFNRDYLPAWTLMGHEFVELKNTHAAIESYRKAIDVNAKDYRAWYGLGQAYELLEMPMYAIDYYNQATSLRPYDCRMWGALATVYEGLGRIQDAIAAHTRALLGADRTQTPEHLGKLAALHTTLDAQRGLPPGSDAVGYHRKILALGQQQGLDAAELAPNFIAVAEYEMRQGANGGERGDWALAAQYLERVMLSNAPQRDKAEELRRELRIREARMN